MKVTSYFKFIFRYFYDKESIIYSALFYSTVTQESARRFDAETFIASDEAYETRIVFSVRFPDR